MTVCIAAIYNNNSILGASDRMVTGGDLTFEPPIPKIFPVTNSIVAMTAGDQNIQIQVLKKASEIVNENINLDPLKWLNVSDVADIYSNCFYQLRNKLIEKRILSQYSLTMESFLSRQKDLSPDFVGSITRRIDRFDIDEMGNHRIETIIAGIDDSGPHIYVVVDGEVSCFDKLGFASIGIGSGQANLHFMLTAYSKLTTEPKALLTIHQAKKKSEVAPGVGKETDMYIVGPAKGTFNMITPIPGGVDIVNDMNKFYSDYTKAIEILNNKTEEQLKDYLAKIIPPEPTVQTTSPSASTNPNNLKTKLAPSPSSSVSTHKNRFKKKRKK